MSAETQVGLFVAFLCLCIAVVVRCLVGIMKILIFDQPRRTSIPQQETLVGRQTARRRSRRRRR
jgi:hypothetical protein